MKVEIFESTRFAEDVGGEIKIDTHLSDEPYMNSGKMSSPQFKSDYYHVNVIAEQRVVDIRDEQKLRQLLVEGYHAYHKPDQPAHYKFFELVRSIVIQDPMINALLENRKLKKDGYLTQNLELQRDIRYVENKLRAECIRSIKTRDKIRKMSFIDWIFRWKKITKEIMEI